MASRYGALALLLAVIPPMLLRMKQVGGYRRFSGWRLLIPISLFAALLGLTLNASVGGESIGGEKAPAFAWTMGGLLFGMASASLAVAHLVFEVRSEGLFYRTAAWIQWTVLGIFAVRIAYRVFAGSAAPHLFSMSHAGFRISHITDGHTLAFAAMLFTYHLSYLSAVWVAGLRRLAQARNIRTEESPPMGAL
jgi:hypothetical protein